MLLEYPSCEIIIYNLLYNQLTILGVGVDLFYRNYVHRYFERTIELLISEAGYQGLL
jgi:hypothetical protein